MKKMISMVSIASHTLAFYLGGVAVNYWVFQLGSLSPLAWPFYVGKLLIWQLTGACDPLDSAL